MKKAKKCKIKKMEKNECRVIRLNTEAIMEFLQEHIMEDASLYFELPQGLRTKGLFYWTMDPETDDFIIFYSRDMHLDFDEVMRRVPDITTDSMYHPNRYVSIFLDSNNKTSDGSLPCDSTTE